MIILLQLSIFSLLPSSTLHHPSHQHSIPLSSCPWLIQTSSLGSPFPILFLTSSSLFCTYQLCFLFPVCFPPILPLPHPLHNPPCDLHFCDSVPVPVVCLVYFYFCFLCSVVDSCVCCHFTVHIFDHLLFLRKVPLSFPIIRVW